MRFTGRTVEEIGETGIEADLDQDRHGQHGDYQRLRQNLFALEAEQKDQRSE